ncbi:MAG: hypothetical protein JRI55_24940, partial [Deltaproteobacteria bacterium]|nr:hypothetical protein [Deltaproteobacteria bacterium]
VEILDTSGNWKDGDTVAIRDIWKKVGSTIPDTLSDAQMLNFFRWLYGEGRAHLLGPILRCTPAVVGAPPSINLLKHSGFESVNGMRERLIYVTSNDGLIHAFRHGKQADGGGAEVFAYIAPSLLDKGYDVFKSGQATSPDSFKWVLAGSPRVDDVYNSDDDDPMTDTWFTQMVVAAGPYNHQLIFLDISNPTDSCDASGCTLKSRPFNVRGLVYTDTSGNEQTVWQGGVTGISHFGEAWSTPALFLTAKKDEPTHHMALASGYGAASASDKYKSVDKGHHYFFYDHGRHVGKHPIDENEALHDPAALTLQVDTAVLADTAGAVDRDIVQKPIIATYQADLSGRIVRYGLGVDKTAYEVYSANPARPFYYAPAVLHMAGGTQEVAIASNTGSADEDDPPSPDIAARILLTSEESGKAGSGTYDLDCAVGDIKTGCSGALDIAKVSTTDLPPATAKPVGSPLMVLNDPDGSGTQRLEVFYLLYAPGSTTGTCTASAGTSYLVRISVDPSTGANTAEDADKISGRASGMTLAGGGTRVVLGKSGMGSSAQASAALPPGDLPIEATAAGDRPPAIEYWREVK